MALIYCISTTDFLTAFANWQNQLEGVEKGEHFMSVVMKYFLQESDFTKELVYHSQKVVSFDSETFVQLFIRWIDQALSLEPHQEKNIKANAQYILKFINDENFAVNNGLIVYERLSDQQKGLKKKNG